MANLTPEQARVLLSKAIDDLKRARERLAQNPSNSSRPPSTRAPWEQVEAQERESEEALATAEQTAEDGKPQADAVPEQKVPTPSPEGQAAKKPAAHAGRRQGAPGHSRTLRYFDESDDR
ncbi:DUF6444 domain-containing protein [Lamprobacter modestohalophilus]|uniref:DUF6444 domain-containing protein n=1 Tax=Lamprobacter modestohalophilus TaxID=1064514 RepID=UPI0019047E93|nr:DUF6444 domain-containing protein [Lamprobacter modestohalophilus]